MVEQYRTKYDDVYHYDAGGYDSDDEAEYYSYSAVDSTNDTFVAWAEDADLITFYVNTNDCSGDNAVSESCKDERGWIKVTVQNNLCILDDEDNSFEVSEGEDGEMTYTYHEDDEDCDGDSPVTVTLQDLVGIAGTNDG